MNIKNRVESVAKEDSNGPDLMQLIGQVIDHRWLIIAVTAFFLLVGTLYTIFATPIYSADALIQVEQKNQNALLNLSDVSGGALSSAPQSAAEIEIINSRMVIGKTVNDLNLDSVVEQVYFPVIGKGLARLLGDKPAEIAVSRLNIPVINGEKRQVDLEINTQQTYTVSRDDNVLFHGRVGQFEQHGDFSILVSDTDAKPGTRFTVTKLNELQAIKRVLSNLSIADKGKDTGMLGMTYLDADPRQASRVLNAITSNYLVQNVERKSEEAQRSLQFLKVQLPQVRADLDNAENKLNKFRRENESVDMSLEAKTALDNSVGVQAQLNELTFKEAEIAQLYTKDHPTYRALLEKRKTLEGEQSKLNKKIAGMPQTQQEILRLTRDVQAGQEIYMQLLNRQQELSISKASTVGNVRIIDNAKTAMMPVKPMKTLIIAASLLAGLLLGIGGVLIKMLFHHGIETPDQLEERGMNVYASIPLSDWQRKKDAELASLRRRKVKLDATQTLVSLGNPADLSVEAIRSLRTSLHFAMMEAKNNILVISGVSPAIGKTFISSNLAALIAKAGQKVLLIDGDMRRGYLHELLGADNKVGLSDLLSGKTEVGAGAVQQGNYNFDFLARGQVPPNPSELLMHPRMEKLLAWAAENYDLVLVDTPPILAVTDAAIIGKQAGTTLLVARFESNTVKEVDISYKRFVQNGIPVKGVILNAVVRKASNAYSYGYDYYDYSYDNKAK